MDSLELAWVAVAGFLASFVDGALGMGFGVTSSTLLLLAGVAPQAASASVNVAKVVTGIAAAISHWRFQNIDKAMVVRLALPGSVGALIGVALLSVVQTSVLKPVLALLLFAVGLRILFKFLRPSAASPAVAAEQAGTAGQEGVAQVKGGGFAPAQRVGGFGLSVAGLCGGLTNGLVGAWGPLVTPYLLHKGVTPRYAIGTVNTAEMVVALVSAVSLLSAFGRGGFDLRIIFAMLLGGVIAAPVAAWVIRHVPARPMGIATALLLLLSNSKEVYALFQ
jgi:uncharacterized membrane protein YfcA